MKPHTIVTILAFCLIGLHMVGCVTETTTTTYPDGRVETVKKTSPAPGSVETGAAVASGVLVPILTNK